MRAYATTTIRVRAAERSVTAPVRVYSAASEADPAWRLVAPSGGRVRLGQVDADTGEPIPPGAALPRAHDSSVMLSAAEWAAVHHWEVSQVTEILSWHTADAVPMWRRERCYYLGPAKGLAAERAYVTLAGAIARARCVGLVLWAPRAGMRPRWAVVSLVPPMRIVVWTLHPAGAVRGPDELPALEAPEDAGRADELARAIVSSATELDHDACIDPIEARLEAAIDARLSGRVPEVGTAIAGATKGAKGVRS